MKSVAPLRGLSISLVNAFTGILLLFSLSVTAQEAGFPGRNVNVIGPPPAGSGELADTGLRQQNEPSCAVNPQNPAQICCGFNDYRGIDIPELGDAWEGISCSRNGGQSWNSQLIPGHKADPEYNLGHEFAADPNLVAAPGGLFYNFIAADRSHVGGIYVQQFAWRNKEDGWPLVQVGGPILISKGTNGRFIDKPHMIGFLNDSSDATVELSWDDGSGAQTQAVPAGNLGMAAAVFVGNENNDGTKILYWSSDDWGKTWNTPTKLTESKGVNSGINLAANGDNVCAVWRRFEDTNETSSILYACSSDRGKRFGKPAVLYENMCPFDQTTLNGVAPAPRDIVSFRTNAFPVLAGDGKKFYAFWSDRGFAAASNLQEGCALRTEEGGFNPSYGRIVFSVTEDNGKNWTTPQPVEDAAQGHQFMPAAFAANGEMIVSWIDNRDDLANFLDVDKQLIVDFWKDGDALYRHTTDIHSARLIAGEETTFTPSIKVSNYTKGFHRSPTGQILGLKQMEYNLVNARLFQKGTAPFIGDYLSVTAKAYNKTGAGKWVNSNTSPLTGSPTFHISWGDNRDVRGNAWGSADADGFSEPSPYTPSTINTVNAAVGDGEQVANATPTVLDPPDNQQTYCAAADIVADRTRDQNIYSAPLYPQLSMRSPGAVKLTGSVQRALPVQLINNSFATEYVRLTIDQQPADYESCGGVASFRQWPEANICPMEKTESVIVKIHPKSSAVRTVFLSSGNPVSDIPVSAASCPLTNEGTIDTGNCTLIATLRMNQDPLESGQNLEQPDFDLINNILTTETHNPDLLNPDLLNPDLLNILIQNPDLLNPDLLNPDLLNPDLINPDLLNLIVEIPDLLNPDLLNIAILNPDLLNPDLLNVVVANPDLLNIIVANPDLLNPELINLLVENPNPSNTDLENLSLANPDLLNPDLLNLVLANPDLLNPDLLNMELANPDLLNPDLLNPDLLNLMVANPDLLNPDLLNPDLLNLDLLNPDLLNPDLLNPDLLNLDLLNPDLLNPDLLNLVLLNPDLLNPDLLNPDLLNPDLLNPDLINPDLLNLVVSNPDLLNPDLLNPDLLNPDLLNPDLLNAVVSYSDLENPEIANEELKNNVNDSYIDVTWQVRNDGNTTTGYMAQPFVAGPEEHTATQLIVSKPYLRQTTRDCLPVIESDNQVVVNIYNPPNQAPIINPDPRDEEVQGLASYWLAPGEVANVTLRIFANDPANLHAGRAGLYVNSEACNSEGACDDQPFELTSRVHDVDGPLLNPTWLPDMPNVEATGPAGGEIIFNKPTAEDIGDDKIVPVNCDYESGDTVPLGSTINTCVAEDSAGNTSAVSFEVTVSDTTSPEVVITVPDDFVLPVEATNPAGALVDYSSWVTARDDVDLNPTVNCSPAADTYFALGTTTIECSAEDFKGNTATTSLSIEVNDSTAPRLTLPTLDIVSEATGANGAEVSFKVSADDDVDKNLTLTCIPASGSTFSLGLTEVTCTATDASNNATSNSFNVVVEDTGAPTLVMPSVDVVSEASGPEGATIAYTVTAEDSVDTNVAIECSPASGSILGLGTHTINCTATDASGNSMSGSFNAIVEDTTPPSLAVPTDDVIGEATGPEGAVMTFGVSATDQVDQNVSISCTSNSGDTFPLTTTVVSCTATDASLNEVTKTFNVIVKDSTAPELTVPESFTSEATGPDGAIVEFNVTTRDTVDPAVMLVCIPPSKSLFGLGTTEVECSATDASGNISVGSFNVTVIDSTAPGLVLPEAINVEADGRDGSNVDFTVTTSDAVDQAVTLACSQPSGSLFELGNTTVNCTAKDASGNETKGSFSVTVSDTTPPVIVTGGSIQQEALSQDGNFVTYVPLPGASDVVDGNVTVACLPTSGALFPIGNTSVNCSASDTRGNVAYTGFTVSILDTISPALNLPDDITEEAMTSQGSKVDYSASATDLDVNVTVDCTPASGSVYPIGTTETTCQATDNSNNTSTGTFNVSVVDTTPPTLTVPADMVVSAQYSTGATVTYLPTATDLADSNVDIACSPASGSEFAIGTTIVSCTATDDAGLTDTGSFSVSVRTDIIWLEPTDDPAMGNLGSNFNFRWGYGADGVLQDSADMIEAPAGKGTGALVIRYHGAGADCNSAEPALVDLDAGRSSLRYSSGEWQLNWQTGQSELYGMPLTAGCYKLEIPRVEGQGSADTKQVILN